MTVSPIRNALWSKGQSVGAFVALADALGLSPGACDRGLEQVSGDVTGDMLWMARTAGLELQPVSTTTKRAQRDLRNVAPAILTRPGSSRRLVLLRGGRRFGVLLDETGEQHRVRWCDLARWVGEPRRQHLREKLLPILKVAQDLSDSRRHRIINALGGDKPFRMGWMLREQPTAGSRKPLIDWQGLLSAVVALAAGHAVQFALFIGAWALLGRAALSGDPGNTWLILWGLMFATVLMLRTLLFWQQGTTALRIGLRLKRGLLRAALAQDPDRLRKTGSGNLLARALETDAFENLAVNGGTAVLLAGVELAIVSATLMSLFGPGPLGFTLVSFMIAVGVLTFAYFRRRIVWTSDRISISAQLVEQLLGYETRVVQQAEEHWHTGEDNSLNQYHSRSRDMDRVARWLRILPRTWFVSALLVLLLVEFNPQWPAWMLAAGVGVSLLVQQSLTQFVGGAGQLAQALVLWRSIGPITENLQVPDDGEYKPVPQDKDRLVARQLSFSYGRHKKVLNHLDLEIETGQQILLTGPSGSGKSTLAKLLAGQMDQEDGQVLFNGLDRKTLGSEQWRRKVVLVPQFHHNHIFPDTLAFNLLLGRGWPPSRKDLAEAQEVCLELGLGELIERMPGGLSQVVGEGGWPLSHGEAARVHIARCILQAPRFAILDESLGPLDPRSFARVMESLKNRIPSLILIAHA